MPTAPIGLFLAPGEAIAWAAGKEPVRRNLAPRAFNSSGEIEDPYALADSLATLGLNGYRATLYVASPRVVVRALSLDSSASVEDALRHEIEGWTGPEGLTLDWLPAATEGSCRVIWYAYAPRTLIQSLFIAAKAAGLRLERIVPAQAAACLAVSNQLDSQSEVILSLAPGTMVIARFERGQVLKWHELPLAEPLSQDPELLSYLLLAELKVHAPEVLEGHPLKIASNPALATSLANILRAMGVNEAQATTLQGQNAEGTPDLLKALRRGPDRSWLDSLAELWAVPPTDIVAPLSLGLSVLLPGLVWVGLQMGTQAALESSRLSVVSSEMSVLKRAIAEAERENERISHSKALQLVSLLESRSHKRLRGSLLHDIQGAVPADAWLEELSADAEGRLILRGQGMHSASAARLADALGKAPRIKRVRLEENRAAQPYYSFRLSARIVMP